MKTLHRSLSIIVIPVILNFVVGCSYFKVDTDNHQEPVMTLKKIALAIQNNDYIILHFLSGNSVMHLKDPVVDTNLLSGALESVSNDHMKYLLPKKRVNRYKVSKGESIVKNEIHIYIKDYNKAQEGVAIPLDQIFRIDVYDPATGTGFSYFLLSVVAVAGVLVLVAAATSCPFVYADGGNGLQFKGELFGGRIYKSLEAEDYLLLTDASARGIEEVMISNELVERDYINFVELIAIDHAAGTKVIPDQHGNFLTVSSPQAPRSATSKLGHDLLEKVSKSDSTYFLFNEVFEKQYAFNEAIFQFEKPVHAEKAKLVLKAKNSAWIDYLWGEFAEYFGSTYESWTKEQGEIPASEHIKWCNEQGILLQVYIEKNGQWEYVDYFYSIGPMMTKDMILEMDISKIEGTSFNMKLVSGFNYWELDYVAVDYTENSLVQLIKSSAVTATGDNGNDLLSMISSTDEQRVLLQERGENITLSFNKIPAPKEVRTVFLHATGYYEHEGKGTGFPNVVKLQKFKEPSAFDQFSIQQMYLLNEKYREQ